MLSIVIPTYNTADMTLRCVRAVSGAAEVIVVDDGSTDGTAELLAGVNVLRLDTNRGFAGAANRGVAAATGDIILLLNSDAIVQPGALDAMLAAFAHDPTLGIAGAQLFNEDGTPQWSGGRTPTLAWMVGVASGAGHLARRFRRRSAKARDVDWVSGAAMAFRREVWTPFSERFRFYCQDIELCLHAKRNGWSVCIVDDARVVHALGGTFHDRDVLWRDLLTWGRSHYGTPWWLFARPVLATAAAIRRIAGGRA